MPCQVRQGKRQRPGLAFVKNDYPRQGRRGFSIGKDIMETNTFEYIWSLLNPQGEYKRRRQACERLWQGYDDNQQRNIYIRIKAKLRQGEFVQLPRGFTVLSSMAHRTFYVYYVRIGFGQRLSEPPCIDHAWSISLRFPELHRYLTVLSSMAHRTFYVHFVRIGFGQRLFEPPYIDHAWSISLRFPLFSYIYENQSLGPHRNQRSVSYGESRGLVALL